MKLSVLKVSSLADGVTHVELNRPTKGNAMNKAFWSEMVACFDAIGNDSNCRAVVLSGSGKFFTVGLDIKDPDQVQSLMGSGDDKDTARQGYSTSKVVKAYQEAFNAVERVPQPVIAVSHSACIGGGMDLLCAADVRICTKDAWFSIKEVDIGLAADVGTLQRIHHCIGSSSLIKELSYTARKMESAEALSCGFVSTVCPTKVDAMKHALEMAKTIAAKSPVAIYGTKVNLNYSREHTVANSLEYMATWQSNYVQTEDIQKAAMASLAKQDQPEFSKL